MTIDTHAHYVPARLLEAIAAKGGDIGVRLSQPASGPPALAFDYGFRARPFFAKLVEPVAARCERLDAQGIDRQCVATWPDIYGYGLAPNACAAWHRMLNDTLADWVAGHRRFAFVASVPLVEAADAAAELERAVGLGAVAAMVPTNIEGTNLGERALDPFWARAEALGLPIMLHPVMVTPAPRAARFALAQIAQYTFDTTLGLGSLIFSGLFDRFPGLSLILPHGGGAFPYLLGRFDTMSGRMDRAAQGAVNERAPSAYLDRMGFDTIVHAPKALRFLADTAGLDSLVLGTDDGFPPADLDPLGSLEAAGFSAREIAAVAEENPRRRLPRLDTV